MKNLVTILTIAIFTITSTFANIVPENSVTIENVEIFTSAAFDSTTNLLEFTTKSTISAIQIIDTDGTIQFLLPVMADHVQLNKNLFAATNYTLGFIIEGSDNIHYTNISIMK